MCWLRRQGDSPPTTGLVPSVGISANLPSAVTGTRSRPQGLSQGMVLMFLLSANAGLEGPAMIPVTWSIILTSVQNGWQFAALIVLVGLFVWLKTRDKRMR